MADSARTRGGPNAANYQKPTPIHLTPGEIDEMQALIDKGELPRDAIKQHFEAEERNVYGFDAKKNRHGEFIEQGAGAPGRETLNHFMALKKAERDRFEPPGTYKTAVEEMWKRDPKRAKAIGLPPAPKEAEPPNPRIAAA